MHIIRTYGIEAIAVIFYEDKAEDEGDNAG